MMVVLNVLKAVFTHGLIVWSSSWIQPFCFHAVDLGQSYGMFAFTMQVLVATAA